MSACVTLLTHPLANLTEAFHLPFQSTVAISKQTAILFLYEVSSSLVTFLKIICNNVKFSSILVPTVCLNLVQFAFQILPLSLKYLAVSRSTEQNFPNHVKFGQNYFPSNGDDLVE